jgi:hypothetical protein
MTEKTSGTAETPRDVYGLLVLLSSGAFGLMRSGIRPAVDAGRLMLLQRGDVESQVALRAVSGSRSLWWAIAKLIGVLALLVAVRNLFWVGITQLQSRGVAIPGGVGSASWFAVQLLSITYQHVMDARLWVGVIVAFMAMRSFCSAMWCSELKLLPLPASSVVARMIAVIFVAACAYHMLNYAIRIVYWLVVIYFLPGGNSYEAFMPWLFLTGLYYDGRPSASMPYILVQELMGHAYGIAYSFFNLMLAVVLSMRLRNVVTTVIIWVVVSTGIMWGSFMLRYFVHSRVQGIVQKSMPGDPGVLVGNVPMWLMMVVLLMIATGLLCRLLERRLLTLMEE